MPLRTWKCPLCGYERRSFKRSPECNHNQDEEGIPVPLVEMELVITAPQTKFMEKIDPERGKSNLVGQSAILKARARNHSRDVELDDLIQGNERQLAHQNGWLKDDGTRRKAIDDK